MHMAMVQQSSASAIQLTSSLLVKGLCGLAAVALSACASAGSTLADKAASGVTIQDCPDCPEMVVVPGGSFIMGSDHLEPVVGELRPEGPIHRVTIERAFAVGKYEITNAQFAAFIGATDYQPSLGCTKWRGPLEVQPFQGNWRDPDYGRPPLPEEPVVCVSWHDAKAYVEWLAGKTGKPYRLLSEAEWEYAARAGQQTIWPWGDDPDGGCEMANIFDLDGAERDKAFNFASWGPVNCSDGFGGVAPVGSKQPNAFGLYDMIGNVWEWNEDCSFRFYDPAAAAAVSGAAVQADGPCDRRAVRGGSWFSQISRNRLSFRGRDPESLASHIFGFRVALTLE
jgi:formylglycine-generating enzyme required for sulfatase activity